MKQKTAQTKAKSQQNGGVQKENEKQVKKEVEEKVAEVAVAAVKVTKKPVKTPAKVPAKKAPVVVVKEEEEVEDEEEAMDQEAVEETEENEAEEEEEEGDENAEDVKMATKSPKKKAATAEEKQKAAEERKRSYEERKQQIEESKDRTVYIKNLKKGTTEEEVKTHFEGCGTVLSTTVVTKRFSFPFAFVEFSETAGVEEAVKLHNSVLNGATIGVVRKGSDSGKNNIKDPKRTILVKNKQQLESISEEKLTTIFGKCGEIEQVDVLCKKVVLAFITYKDEKSAKDALELSGTTAEDDLEIEVEEYKGVVEKSKNTIFVQNVKPGTTEEQIRELLETSGSIESVFLKGNFAIIQYSDSDGFCKSFLLNESILQGQMIFLEPYSQKKQQTLKKTHPGKKRPMPYNKGGHQKRSKFF